MPQSLHELNWQLCVALSALLAFSALLCGWLGRRVIPWLVKRKLNDGEPRKASEYLNMLHGTKKHTPTMGGVFLVPAIAASALVGGLALTILGADPVKVWGALGLAGLALLSHAALGMVDDFTKLTRRQGDGLRSRTKLAAQTLIALVCCTGAVLLLGTENAVLRGPGIEIALGWWLVPVGMFIMVGASNAYNLTDGLDGLAGGTGAVAFHAMALAAALVAMSGTVDADIAWTVAMLGVASAGALVGFLYWNRHPARVFMGDTGSLGLGALLGLMAVIGRLELVLALAGGVFVAEALSVMLQVGFFKATGGRRILRCAPLHHHFQFGGWHETKVTRRFIAAGMLLAALSIGLLPSWSPVPEPGSSASTPLETVPEQVEVPRAGGSARG